MMKKPAKPITYETALERCAAACARAEHSAGELRKKMARWRLPRQDADRVIDFLYDNAFIDDARFAHAFVNDKVAFDLWGRIKIRQALRLHGIDSETIAAALDDVDSELYRHNLDTLLQQKAKLTTETDPYKRKTALYRFAASRGYESELALPIINRLVSGGDDFDVDE